MTLHVDIIISSKALPLVKNNERYIVKEKNIGFNYRGMFNREGASKCLPKFPIHATQILANDRDHSFC